MTWFKVDDGLADHPKVEALLAGSFSESALALWVTCGAWCAKHLTDGFVPVARVKRSGFKHSDRAALDLVRVGMWESVDGGFQFKSWSDYQPTRARVEADRSATAEKVRRHRKGSSEGLKQSTLDRCGSKCHHCGAALSASSMTVDHLIARKNGGSTSLDNCVSACISCNSRRKAGPLVTCYNCECVTSYKGNGNQPVTASRPVPSRPDPSQKSESAPSAEPHTHHEPVATETAATVARPAPVDHVGAEPGFTARRMQSLFIAEFEATQRATPNMGGKAVADLHGIVSRTAALQGVEPSRMYLDAIRTWLSKGLSPRELQSPYACFCQAWGSLTARGKPALPERPETGDEHNRRVNHVGETTAEYEARRANDPFAIAGRAAAAAERAVRDAADRARRGEVTL